MPIDADDRARPVSDCALSILLVDDDPHDRAYTASLLRRINGDYLVLYADSGEQAGSLLRQSAIDCMLIDYHLPDGHADRMINHFRELAADAQLPLLIISGCGDEEKAASSMRLGASDYITKDRLTVLSLQRAISNAVEKSRLARSLGQEREKLVAANAALARKNREIQSFYHTVSHELKTPITAIREFTALMADGILGEINADQAECLATSLACCDRLTRLVNDLFDAARIETGKLELHHSSSDLALLVSREVELMRGQALDKGIDLSLEVEPDLPLVSVDGNRMGQVLCNLISNALKFTERGGFVRVTVARRSSAEGPLLEITVADNGYGISSEHAELIFDRLYQCSQETTSSQNGMGIGLYLCSQIIHLHGGRLSVDSRLGEGSTFRCTLPLAREPALA